MNKVLLSLDRIIQTNELIKNLYIGLNSLVILNSYLNIAANYFILINN